MNTTTKPQTTTATYSIGDQLTYTDMANQNGPAFTVVALPERTRLGFMTDYVLIDMETGAEKQSDLRQLGWKLVA